MSIGNKPAYPFTLKASDNPCNFTIINDNPCNFTIVESGLTFRERLIVAAVQGFCANTAVHDAYTQACVDVAEQAIKQADAVIAELEKEGNQ